jgi:hypothetical protein
LMASLLIVLVAAGCSDGDATEAVESTHVSPTQPGETVQQSPLAAPTLTATWDAEPAPGTASLRGQIEIAQDNVLLGELFLAKAVPTSQPDVDLLELDEENSPRALLDRATGEFLFTDVEPGKYGLIVWEPMSSGAVNDPETGETLFVELDADETVDLGRLTFP